MPGVNLTGLCSRLQENARSAVNTFRVRMAASGHYLWDQVGPGYTLTDRTDFTVSRTVTYTRIPFVGRDYEIGAYPTDGKFWFAQWGCCCPCRIGLALEDDTGPVAFGGGWEAPGEFTRVRTENGSVIFTETGADAGMQGGFQLYSTSGYRYRCRSNSEDKLDGVTIDIAFGDSPPGGSVSHSPDLSYLIALDLTGTLTKVGKTTTSEPWGGIGRDPIAETFALPINACADDMVAGVELDAEGEEDFAYEGGTLTMSMQAHTEIYLEFDL